MLRKIRLSGNFCSFFGVESGTIGVTVDFLAYEPGGDPVYAQEAFIPPNPYRLRLED